MGLENSCLTHNASWPHYGRMNPFRSHRRMVALLALPMFTAVAIVALAVYGGNGWAITYSDGVTADGIVVVVTK